MTRRLCSLYSHPHVVQPPRATHATPPSASLPGQQSPAKIRPSFTERIPYMRDRVLVPPTVVRIKRRSSLLIRKQRSLASPAKPNHAPHAQHTQNQHHDPPASRLHDSDLPSRTNPHNPTPRPPNSSLLRRGPGASLGSSPARHSPLPPQKVYRPRSRGRHTGGERANFQACVRLHPRGQVIGGIRGSTTSGSRNCRPPPIFFHPPPALTTDPIATYTTADTAVARFSDRSPATIGSVTIRSSSPSRTDAGSPRVSLPKTR